MPGFLLHVGATVLCAHGGQAQPTAPSPRVTVAGQPAVALPAPWAIAGCTLPPNAGGPCVTAQYVSGATRVTTGGQPLLLIDSQAVCAPTGTPVVNVVAQTRVTGI
jgi:hypothetical protein